MDAKLSGIRSTSQKALAAFKNHPKNTDIIHSMLQLVSFNDHAEDMVSTSNYRLRRICYVNDKSYSWIIQNIVTGRMDTNFNWHYYIQAAISLQRFLRTMMFSIRTHNVIHYANRQLHLEAQQVAEQHEVE